MVVVWVSNEIARSVLSESMIKIEARNAEQSSRCFACLLFKGRKSPGWREAEQGLAGVSVKQR